MTEFNTDIYKEAVSDPLSDQNKLLQVYGAAQGIVQRNQEIQHSQVKLATERFGAINNAAAGLISDPDMGVKDLTPKLWDVLGRLTKGDTMTAAHAVQFMQQFPSDPRLQAQAIKNVYSQTLGPWERGKAWLGENTPLQTGGGTKFIQQPAFGSGAPQDRGYVPNTLSPGTTKVNPDLSQSYVGGEGNPSIQPPAVPTPRARPAGAPAAQSATPMAAPPPGQAEGARVSGGESGKAVSDARNRSLNYQQEVNPLEQAIPTLEKLGTRGTGPGTETVNHLKSFVLSNVPGADFKGLKDDVAAYDKAKKYLTDWVNQNGNSGTNDKLAAAFAGNPSTNISNAAAVDVAKTALALRRFKQAQLVSFEKSGKQDADFAKEAGKFAREHDPRAFGFDMMTPTERKKVLDSLSEAKRAMFMLDVQEAAQNNIIRAPQSK